MFVNKKVLDAAKNELQEAKNDLQKVQNEIRNITQELGLSSNSGYNEIQSKIKEMKSLNISLSKSDKKNDTHQKIGLRSIEKHLADMKEVDKLDHNKEYDFFIGDDHPDNTDWEAINNLPHNKQYAKDNPYE